MSQKSSLPQVIQSVSEALMPDTSNHYKHGLTSRARADEWFDDAETMARELIRDEPSTPEIMEVARSLSGQVLLLQAIRKEKRRLITTPPPPEGYEEFSKDPFYEDMKHDVIHSGVMLEKPVPSWALHMNAYVQYEAELASYVPTAEATAELLNRQEKALCRIDAYERKARSRIRRLVRRLDYLVIEEKRKAVAAGKAHV